MSENGSKPWGEIQEIEVSDIPPLRPSKFYELYEELCLRLEQTPPQFALQIVFEDYNDAKIASATLRKYFTKRKGKGAVDIRTRSFVNGSGTLYVYRGENWK